MFLLGLVFWFWRHSVLEHGIGQEDVTARAGTENSQKRIDTKIRPSQRNSRSLAAMTSYP